MIVCLCHRVSDQYLTKLIVEGAYNLESIQKQCGAGTSCGSCVEIINTMLKSQVGKQNHEQERRQTGNHSSIKRCIMR